MATPINAPMAGEIWHLSIEDLFQPVQEAPRLGGDGPFVINLSVSTAPISVPTKAFTHSPLEAHVYQIQVTEDGRTRYRLRLGPFASEDEADAILAEVRDTYPGALTATASASDLRVISSMQAKAENRPKPAKPADLVIEKSVSQRIAAQQPAPVLALEAAVAAAEKAAQKVAPQRAVAQKAAPQKGAPRNAPVAPSAPSAPSAKAEVAEISIDIAWPTPELVVPASMPRAASPAAATLAPAVKKEPAPVAVAAASQTPWALPELDVPLPSLQRPAPAPMAPPAKQAAASVPAPEPFELKLAPPFSMASVAPVLTEVVTPKKAQSSKSTAAKRASVAARVLPDSVATKLKAPPSAPPAASPAAVAPMIAAAAIAHTHAPAPVVAAPAVPAAAPAVPSPVAHAPVVIAAAAPAVKVPPHPESVQTSKPETSSKQEAPPPKQETPPPRLEVAPLKQEPLPPKQEAAVPKQEAPKKNLAPPPKKTLAPPPKQPMPAPAKPAAPKNSAPFELTKPAPVLTQSVAPTRKPWPKFREALTKPLANKLTSLQHVVVATAPAPAPREVKKLDEPLESLESTQTIRALTPMEIEDHEASRWYVIQLALADHAFDPDAVPNLDIFSEYRLYSVAGLDQGRVVHALRLGFFREEIGAVAVASYLAGYWDKPTIKRVSLAERERFADQRVEARKDVGATGKHAIIEITDELVARRRRSTKPATVKSPSRPLEH